MSFPSLSGTSPLLALSGWVKRKGGRQGLWHKRFLSISGTLLTISKDDRNEVVEQEIRLQPGAVATLIEGTTPPRFQIDVPGCEPLLFTTEVREDAMRWITVISTVCSVPSQSSITMDQFRVISVIGRGFYGKVMLCQKVDTGELYAIKSIHKELLALTEKTETVISERNIMMRVHHPFIVNLCFAFQTPSKFYLGLEYVSGGELFYHMQKLRGIDIDDARLYVAEIGLALSHLHTLGIIYRDLKPENVLLDKGGHIKLTDFGLSKLVDLSGTTSTFCGTSEYLAPEVLTQLPYSYAVDIWTLGILTYEMLLGATPFYNGNKVRMYTAIAKSDPQFPPTMDARVIDFISRALTKDPRKRPTFEELKGHPFFEGVNWTKVLNREYRPNFIPPSNDPLTPTNFDTAFTSEVAADSLVLPGMGDEAKVPGFSYFDDTISLLA
jgi:serine/threonine protein kinase